VTTKEIESKREGEKERGEKARVEGEEMPEGGLP
jgi:hypothetical protein